MTSEQMDELYEKFYSHLKELDKVTPRNLDECIQETNSIKIDHIILEDNVNKTLMITGN